MLFFRRRSNKQTIELTGRLHKYKLKRVDSSFIIISHLDRKIKEGVDVIMEKMSQSMDAVKPVDSVLTTHRLQVSSIMQHTTVATSCTNTVRLSQVIIAFIAF